MKLWEIIQFNNKGKDAVLVELLLKYKKSLITYYTSEFGKRNKPVLMILSVLNAAQYGLIVPENDLRDCFDIYFAESGLKEEELDDEWELVCHQSIPLEKL